MVFSGSRPGPPSKTFQKKNRLAVDGFVGPTTWTKLIVTLKRGSHGSAVTALQHQLRFEYGYKSLVVDGAFGASTETAVKNFQSKHRLLADGTSGQPPGRQSRHSSHGIAANLTDAGKRRSTLRERRGRSVSAQPVPDPG